MDDPDLETQIKDVAEILRQVANEPIMFRRVERLMDPRPCDLSSDPDDARALQARVERLVTGLGGGAFSNHQSTR